MKLKIIIYLVVYKVNIIQSLYETITLYREKKNHLTYEDTLRS